MEKYGAVLLAEALLLLAGVAIWSFGDGNVAESGFWLTILSAGAAALTVVAAFDDSKRRVPPRK